MALIDQKRARRADRGGMLPDIRPRRCPDLPVKRAGLGILHHAADIQRDAVKALPVRRHLYLHAGTVGERMAAGERDLPVAVSDRRHRVGLPVPAVEIADQVHRLGGGRPFAVDPALAGAVEAVKQMPCGKGGQLLLRRKQTAAGLPQGLHAGVNGIRIGAQIGVERQNAPFLCLAVHGRNLPVRFRLEMTSVILLLLYRKIRRTGRENRKNSEKKPPNPEISSFLPLHSVVE